jgi:hypothetical protein
MLDAPRNGGIGNRTVGVLTWHDRLLSKAILIVRHGMADCKVEVLGPEGRPVQSITLRAVGLLYQPAALPLPVNDGSLPCWASQRDELFDPETAAGRK